MSSPPPLPAGRRCQDAGGWAGRHSLVDVVEAAAYVKLCPGRDPRNLTGFPFAGWRPTSDPATNTASGLRRPPQAGRPWGLATVEDPEDGSFTSGQMTAITAENRRRGVEAVGHLCPVSQLPVSCLWTVHWIVIRVTARMHDRMHGWSEPRQFADAPKADEDLAWLPVSYEASVASRSRWSARGFRVRHPARSTLESPRNPATTNHVRRR